MKFVVEDMIAGAAVMAVAAALLMLGKIMGDAWIADDCYTFGKFKAGGAVYECRKATPETVSATEGEQ